MQALYLGKTAMVIFLMLTLINYLNLTSWLVGAILHSSTNKSLRMNDRSEMDVMKVRGKSGGLEETAKSALYQAPPDLQLAQRTLQG